VIEDDDNVRRMLRLSLEGYGYEVMEAGNGRQGLALYMESPADLVLTDLVMPDKEGLETIIDLRKSNPKVKIIAMSGGSHSSAGENLNMARHFGAAALIAKPFETSKLVKTIASLLGELPPDAAAQAPAQN